MSLARLTTQAILTLWASVPDGMAAARASDENTEALDGDQQEERFLFAIQS